MKEGYPSLIASLFKGTEESPKIQVNSNVKFDGKIEVLGLVQDTEKYGIGSHFRFSLPLKPVCYKEKRAD